MVLDTPGACVRVFRHPFIWDNKLSTRQFFGCRICTCLSQMKLFYGTPFSKITVYSGTFYLSILYLIHWFVSLWCSSYNAVLLNRWFLGSSFSKMASLVFLPSICMWIKLTTHRSRDFTFMCLHIPASIYKRIRSTKHSVRASAYSAIYLYVNQI